MIQIILFVAACLVWQKIKDALRGPRVPTVSIKASSKAIKARCGCSVVNGNEGDRVVEPCAAHKVMLDA